MSFDGKGRGAALWVRSRVSDHQTDTLMARSTNGRGWQRPVALATSEEISQPRVAELGDGRAIAAWVQYSLTPKERLALTTLKGQRNINRYLDFVQTHHQLFGSVYSHGQWSAATRLSRRGVASFDPALAAGSRHGRALLIWVQG